MHINRQRLCYKILKNFFTFYLIKNFSENSENSAILLVQQIAYYAQQLNISLTQKYIPTTDDKGKSDANYHPALPRL